MNIIYSNKVKEKSRKVSTTIDHSVSKQWFGIFLVEFGIIEILRWIKLLQRMSVSLY